MGLPPGWTTETDVYQNVADQLGITRQKAKHAAHLLGYMGLADLEKSEEMLGRLVLKQKVVDQLAEALRDYDNAVYNNMAHHRPIPKEVYERHAETIRLASSLMGLRQRQKMDKNPHVKIMDRWERGRAMEQARRMTADHEMGGSLIGAYKARGGSWADWRSRDKTMPWPAGEVRSLSDPVVTRPKRLWPHQEAAMDWLRTAGYDRLFHSGGLVVDMREDMIDNMVLETLDRKVADRLEWAWQKHGENHAGCFWSDAAQDYVWMGLVTPDTTVGWKPWLTVHDSRVEIDTSFQREMTLNEAKLVCELELKGELPRRAYSGDARAADCWWVGRRLVGPGVNGATIVEAWQVGSQWRAERRAGSGLHRSVEPMYWRRQPGSLEEARQGLEAVVDFTCLPA